MGVTDYNDINTRKKWEICVCGIVISKGVPRQANVAQGVPGRLRLWIILTFRHYKGGIVVDNCVIYI